MLRTCQTFHVLAFSPLLSEMFDMFILSMTKTTSCFDHDSSNAPPDHDVNNFYSETCFVYGQTKHVLA